MILFNKPRRLSRYQRSRIARRARALSMGKVARRAVTALVCSKHPYKTVRRLRKHCPTTRRVPLGAFSRGVSSPYSFGAVVQRNPQAATLSAKNIFSGFSPAVYKDAIPIALGAIIHQQISPRIAAGIGWTDGWKKLVIDLGTSGLELLVPKFGSRLFMGGLVRVLVINGLPLIEKFMTPQPSTSQMKNIQDYEMGDDLGRGYTDDLGRSYVDEGMGVTAEDHI